MITHSPEETKQEAAKLAKTLKGGEVISLIGDLGSGKTTFVQGLVFELGGLVKVKSPTFTLMNVYPVQHKKIRQVVHVDGYRLQGNDQDLGLDEFDNQETIIVAEWPNIRQKKRSSITIEFSLGNQPNERQINIIPAKRGTLPRQS